MLVLSPFKVSIPMLVSVVVSVGKNDFLKADTSTNTNMSTFSVKKIIALKQSFMRNQINVALESCSLRPEFLCLDYVYGIFAFI